MCKLILETEVMPGLGCCHCLSYNGLQRQWCRSCSAALCKVEVPESVLRCPSCGFGFRPESDPLAGRPCPVCGGSLPEPKPAEHAIIVCMPTAMGNPGGFTDNVIGACAGCSQEIQWRPHMPAGEHLCVSCAFARVQGLDPEPLKIRVEPKTIDEVFAFIEQRAQVDNLKKES